MKIDIEARSFALTNPLRGYVQRRLCRTLCWYTDRIERIALVLEEVKGSRPGVAYKSRIRVKVAHLPVVVIEESGAHLCVAVDRAASRAGRKLARATARGIGPQSIASSAWSPSAA